MQKEYTNSGTLKIIKFALADDCIRNDFLFNEINSLVESKIDEHRQLVDNTPCLPNLKGV